MKKLSVKIIDGLRHEARQAVETCQRMIMIMPCGEPVTVEFRHKADKRDINRMCSACAAAIQDTSEYTRHRVDPYAKAEVTISAKVLNSLLDGYSANE